MGKEPMNERQGRFKPGDKVIQKMPPWAMPEIWRVISRLAHYDIDYITLRKVDNPECEIMLPYDCIVDQLELICHPDVSGSERE